MIISDRYRLVFVHIPKCAGTSVRHPLQHIDDCNGFYTARVEQHPILGLLDYVHIPLFTMRQYFNSNFDKVNSYWSFAVVRDPFERFPSSISQRLKEYVGGPIQNQSTGQIKAEIERTIHYLLQQPRVDNQLPAEYIHFQKQVDYVYLDGIHVVDSLYVIDEIDQLLKDVSARAGETLVREGRPESRQANQSVVYRSEAVRRLAEASRPFMRSLYRAFPASVKQSLQSMVYVPRIKRLNSLFSSEYVTDFIEDYYHEDLVLFSEVKEARLTAKRVHS